MLHFIAFFSVDNELEIGRGEINALGDDKEIVELIKKLQDSNEYVKIYNLSETGFNTLLPSISDLVDDYNDEELDGGMWSINFDWEDEKSLVEYLNGEFEEKIVNAVTANANKYLENTIETENGTIYRKDDWENADPDEIIYIGEFGLTELDKLIEEGKNPTDAELIEQNIASSKNTIRAEIKQYYPEATDEWIDKHDLIADIMEFASWEYTATVVAQIDEWDIWDDYPEK